MTSAPRLSRVSTATAILFALAAAPAAAGPAFLKLGGVEGDTGAAAEGKKDFYKGWIELNSWSWGTSHSAGSASKTMTMKGSAIGQNSTAGDPDRPLVSGRLPNASKESTEKGGTEDMNIGVGELQEASGRRQHKPMTITKEWDASTPLLRQGSMTTLVPAGTCRVGARYPGATLDTGQTRFEMENIMVTSCSTAGSGGQSLPLEEISFNYGKVSTIYGRRDKAAPKVKVRGWNPETKE